VVILDYSFFCDHFVLVMLQFWNVSKQVSKFNL